MITVPTSSGSVPASTPSAPPIDDVYLMMAAAQMHKEGRLIQSEVPDTVQGGQTLQYYKPGHAEWEGQGRSEMNIKGIFEEPPKDDRTDEMMKELNQRRSNHARPPLPVSQDYPPQWRTVKGVGTKI